MALQQAQLLLNMNSLEPVNFGIQQNNTEAFAVALCHLAELHAEQVSHCPLQFQCPLHLVPVLTVHCVWSHQGLFGASAEILKHLKEQFPPHTKHAEVRGVYPTSQPELVSRAQFKCRIYRIKIHLIKVCQWIKFR